MSEDPTPYRPDRLDALAADATEAEVEPGRHEMEEAILATLATVGPGHPFGQVFLKAYHAGTLTFSRRDLEDVGIAFFGALCENQKAFDRMIIDHNLQVAGRHVPGAVLDVILGGTKAKDIEVAKGYLAIIEKQDLFKRAEAAGKDYFDALKNIKKEADVTAAASRLLRTATDIVTRKKLVREDLPEKEDARGFVASLLAHRDDKRAFLGLDSGFGHINEVLNGLPDGVIVLAGSPSCGKTTLAKQIADHVALTEKVPVLFYSFEQSKEELRIKSLARRAMIDSRDIWKGRVPGDAWEQVEKAGEEYRRGEGSHLVIIEASRDHTLDHIRAAALTAKHKAGGGRLLLVIDYLQIIPSGDDAPDAIREKIDRNLSELRRLSRELQSPILVISSQNRAGYSGKDKKPTLTALKESGGIEYSADVVICLWRDKCESEALTSRFQRTTIRVEAHILKNRNGELAKVLLDFSPAWATFSEAGRERLSFEDALGE